MTRRLALVLVLVFAAPAGAKVVHFKNFKSPSGMITCITVVYGGKGVECSAPYLPPSKYGTDPYYGLKKHGKAILAERGDYPGDPKAKQRTLHYGDTYKRKGVRCTMRESGLTCRNKDGHGFHLSKGNIGRF